MRNNFTIVATMIVSVAVVMFFIIIPTLKSKYETKYLLKPVGSELCKESGGSFIEPAHNGRMFFCYGKDKNLIETYERYFLKIEKRKRDR